jgi:hypothetical protein
MDFRLQKLRVALSILAAGMVVALVYHGIEGWVLGQKYPYNTFLCLPVSRFSDFFNARRAAMLTTPYALGLPDGYFPSSYGIFYRLFTLSDDHWKCLIVFLLIGIGGAILIASHALRPLTIALMNHGRGRDSAPAPALWLDLAGLLLAIVFLLLCEPFPYVIDRANNELHIALLVAMSLIFIGQGRFIAGLACLLPGICFKLYPAVLLVLFLRRGKLRWIAVAGLAFVVVNWASLASYPAPLSQSWSLEKKDYALMYQRSLIENEAMAGSATPWNAVKLVTAALANVPNGPPDDPWPSLHPLFARELVVFSVASLLGAILVTLYGCLVEKEFLRRAIMLLLFLVTASPYGGDYKLLHIMTALVALLLIPTRRHHDLLATALLALALIPKREILFPFAGFSDSGARDISLAIVVNPLCLLLAAGFLAWDALEARSPAWSAKRFHLLTAPIFAAGSRSRDSRTSR